MPTQSVTKKTELQFINHVAADLPEQDVYVIKEDGYVYRLSVEETEDQLDAPLFTVSESNPHDPFALSEKPFGPYQSNAELGFTLREWLGATGSGTYSIQDDVATLDLTFAKLVPNATYTLWCNTVALPPNFNIIDEACGFGDGSDNQFVTDSAGNAIFRMTLSPLAKSTATVLRSIALAYHSDGQTYGDRPGPFGYTTHVQLFSLIPDPASEAWITSPSDSRIAVVDKK